MSRRMMAMVVGLLMVVAACGDDDTSNAPASCDSPATPIALGATVEGRTPGLDADYPANSLFYCLSVPDGVGAVTIEMSGATADLDLYVGYGSIEAVGGVDEVSEREGFWVSNEFGTVDELVVIADPEPGIYYIEVTPYERNASPFTLSASS